MSRPAIDVLNQLMQRYVQPLYALRERARGYEVAMMKEAMEMLGMPAGPVRPPLMPSRPRDLEDLRRLIDVYRNSEFNAIALAPRSNNQPGEVSETSTIPKRSSATEALSGRIGQTT